MSKQEVKIKLTPFIDQEDKKKVVKQIKDIPDKKDIKFGLVDDFSRPAEKIKDTTNQIKDAQEQVNQATKDYGSIATKSFTESLASLGLALNAIDQIGGKLLDLRNASVSFNQSLATIGTLGAKNFRDLREPILQLTKEIPYTAEQIYTK